MSKKIVRPLPQTEIKALKWIEVKPGARDMEVYHMSGSRGHPNYVTKTLFKKGLIKPLEDNAFGWELTDEGYRELMLYRKDVELESDCP